MKKIRFFSVLGFLLFFSPTGFSQDQKHSDPDRPCMTSECHVEVKKHKKLHGPIKIGQCVVCHSPVAGSGHKFNILETGVDNCKICHETLPEVKFAHKPVAEGKCLSCHAPHGASTQALLKKHPEAKVCYDCHKPFGKKKFQHGAIKKGHCNSCHPPHGSKTDNLLNKKGMAGCFECHKSTARKVSGRELIVHRNPKMNCRSCHTTHESDFKSLLVKDFTDLCMECHRPIRRSGMKNFAHRTLVERKNCTKCHDVHKSTRSKLLKGDEQKLCLECHESIKTSLSKKFIHEPLKEKPCTLCHVVHEPGKGKMLRQDYTTALYTKDAINEVILCFDCHAEGPFRSEDTDQTRFRNGTRNLHNVHVIGQKSYGCAACHEVHGSDSKGLIRNSFEFLGWKVTNDFLPTDTGGSCATGCHRVMAYDREKPVENPETVK